MKIKHVLILMTGMLVASCSSDMATDLQPKSSRVDGNHVSLTEALQTAEEVFSDVYGKSVTRSVRFVSGVENYYSDNVLTRSGDENPDFYIVNYGNEEGFALLSADRRRNPVYAFSDTGHLHVGDTATNPGLKSYLEAISPIPDPFNPKDSLHFETGTWTVTVAPLLTEQVRDWDQISLNKYVKNKNGCTNAPVGCVALSCGQIMSYHGWPESVEVKNESGVTEKYEFDWTVLKHKRTDDKLARLMEILGRKENLNMSYNEVSEGGSGAFMGTLSRTFVNMGYERTSSKTFTPSVATNHLKSSGPFVVGGKSDGEEYGHAWVIDGLCEQVIELSTPTGPGFIKNLYYHFVWGHWGGGNGYYYFSQNPNQFNDTPGYRDEKDPPIQSLGAPMKNISMYYNFKKVTK